MVNLYEDIRSNLHFKQFQIGDLLFAEYTCPPEEDAVPIWAHMDYLIHVVSGKKTWHTPNGTWTAGAGQTLFFKKGAAVIEQHFDEDFCLLVFFIPDAFVRDIVKEMAGSLSQPSVGIDPQQSAMRVRDEVALSAFFQSMLVYFSEDEKPSEPLLRFKLRELIVSLLYSKNNPGLSSYFQSLANSDTPSIPQIMQANFKYNLALEDFAKLCHRSLSSFKRDFRKHYNMPPGKWLLEKRLDHAAVLLRNGDMPVSQVVFECGFENLSHFSKAFKDKFGVSPSAFRHEATEVA